MIKSKRLRRIVMVISLIMLMASTVNTTYGFIVTSTEPVENVFVPEDVKVNGVTLDKTVEHPYGEGYKIPDNISFDFKVELGSDYANELLNTTAGEITADENGGLKVSVKPGVTFGIEGLEEGTEVKVTEQATTLAGFTVKGEPVKKVTVDADGNASVEFINTYTPESVQPTNIDVKGIKILEGRDWANGDTFSFKLEQQNGDSWTELGTRTVTYSAGKDDFNKFDFSEIVQDLIFDKVGTYTFRMSEIAGNLDNVDYDETVNYFTLKVTDTDMDGKLEINTIDGTDNAKVTEENGKYTVEVTFNNTFEAAAVPDPITVNVEVNKSIKNTGEQSIGPEGFKFVLKNITTGEKSTVTSDSDGKAIFDLSFSKADIGKTYTYKLSEINEGEAGITYDTDVYEIEVSVRQNEDNKLVADMTMNGTAVETLVAEFENTYCVEEHLLPTTGDNSNLTFWFIMMIVSGAALIALIIYERRRVNMG